MYCTSITHYMMGNMTVTFPRIRPYFSQCFVLLNNHQYNCNITKSFLSVDGSHTVFMVMLFTILIAPRDFDIHVFMCGMAYNRLCTLCIEGQAGWRLYHTNKDLGGPVYCRLHHTIKDIGGPVYCRRHHTNNDIGGPVYCRLHHTNNDIGGPVYCMLHHSNNDIAAQFGVDLLKQLPL